MSRHAAQTALIAVVAVLTLSACSPATSEPQPTPTAATPDFVTLLDPTWTTEAALVGDPIDADGFVASYVAEPDGTLDVVAWNATTGTEVWRDEAAVGMIPKNEGITLGALDSGGKSFVTYVTSVEGDDTAWVRLVIAEIGTGTPTQIPESVIWVTRLPSACTDGIAVCFTGNLEADGADPAIFRIDPKVGIIVPEPAAVIPDGARRMGDRLFSTSDRSPDGVEQLGYAVDGAVVWQRPYTDVFAEGYSSDGGYNWQLSGSDEMIVGIGSYVDPNRLDSGEGVVDLTQTKAVGLDPATGNTVWTLESTSICTASFISPDFIDGLIPMCRFNSGTRTTAPGADGTLATTEAEIDIDLLGVDPLTGEIEWTLPLGGSGSPTTVTDAYFGTQSPFRPLDVAGTVSLVNALTGDVTDLPADAVFTCTQPRADFEMVRPGTSEVVLYPGGYSRFPCTSVLGAIAGTGFSAGALNRSGIDTKNTVFIAGESALSLYTLTD